MTEAQSSRGRVVGPESIIARTSGRCQAEYGTFGYDLRTIRHGERVAEQCIDFRLWVELEVVSHLTGRPTNRLPQSIVEQIADQQMTVLYTAVTYAVDEAVAERSFACHDRFSPADLAAHIARALQLHLWDGCSRDVCPAENQWTATPFLTNHVLDALAEHASRRTTRHPKTTYWEADLGIRLPGRTAAEQLHNAQWAWATCHSERVVHGVLLGAASPSQIEHCVGADRASEEWPAAVGNLLAKADADDMVIAALQSLPFSDLPRRAD